VSAPGTFADACHSTKVADGVYEKLLDTTYWGYNAQFGGYAHALVLTAMRDALDLPAMAPATMSVHFVRPFLEGPFRCEVDVVRRGRTMANVHARAYSGGKLAGQAIASFARRREIGPFLAQAPPPELSQTVGPGEASVDPAMGIPNHVHFEFWPRVGSFPARTADGNRVGGWVRMRDEAVVDENLLVMVNDLWPPVAYHLWDPAHVAVSADITTQFRGELPARVAPGEPVFVQLRTAACAGGLVDEDTEVWSAAGELLCQGRQVRFVHG
jgi:acyl-CoA thioesterase